MIRERTQAGLAAARAEGRIGGRRRKLDAGKRADSNDAVQAYRTEGVHLF
jgi:DNA invertase Pin-like site-specific DNA recombinase